MRRIVAACLLFCALPYLAQAQALKLQAEYVVAGMQAGNLSGLARCGEHWLAVSDRADGHFYQLEPAAEGVWQAQPVAFAAPAIARPNLPWGMRTVHRVLAPLRGGQFDFEAISCDQQGNRYLLSESYVAVLAVPYVGQPYWLELAPALLQHARSHAMLRHPNRLLEGLAIEPNGQRLWLAAEENRRGLLALHRDKGRWLCRGSCVIHSETGKTQTPQDPEGPLQALDYSDLSFWQGKLFTLERAAHQICRRNLQQGHAERCWSFAEQALQPERRYPTTAGVAEALVVNASGAWVGVDNGNMQRADGEARPIIWHFAAPAEGWHGR